MKGIILKLRDGKDYYVLEEIIYDNKKYVLAAFCDLNDDYINDDELVVMEVKVINDELVVDEIYDDNIAHVVVRLFREKMQNNED